MRDFAFVTDCYTRIRSINNFTLFFDRASYKVEDFRSPNVLM